MHSSAHHSPSAPTCRSCSTACSSRCLGATACRQSTRRRRAARSSLWSARCCRQRASGALSEAPGGGQEEEGSAQPQQRWLAGAVCQDSSRTQHHTVKKPCRMRWTEQARTAPGGFNRDRAGVGRSRPRGPATILSMHPAQHTTAHHNMHHHVTPFRSTSNQQRQAPHHVLAPTKHAHWCLQAGEGVASPASAGGVVQERVAGVGRVEARRGGVGGVDTVP